MEKPVDSPDRSEDSEEYPGKELIHLDNGTTHPMVVRYRTKAYWTYLCFPCGATCLGETFLRSHFQGKKHNMHILSKQVWSASIIDNHPFFVKEENKQRKNHVAVFSSSSTENVVIAPGEPVPPGVEEAIRAKSAIEESLKSTEFPVVGLEYMVELLEEDKDPSYFCSLCGVRGNPYIILRHIDGHRHKMKYMSINYPKCYNELRKYCGMDKYHPGNVQVLHNICQCIDQANGRLPPLVIQQEEFEKNKEKLLKQISEGKHFTERDGEDFLELVDEEYIIMVSKTHKNTVESNSADNSYNKMGSTEETHDKSKITTLIITKNTNSDKSYPDRKVQRSLRRRPSVDSISSLSNVSDDDLDNDCIIVSSSLSSQKKNPYGKSSFSIDRKNVHPNAQRLPAMSSNSYDNKRSKSPFRSRSPRSRQYGSSSKDTSFPTRDRNRMNPNIISKPQSAAPPDKEKIELYRKRFNKCVEDAKKVFEYNEQYPEKHPSYQAEWKKYWNKKYKEFQGDKKDIMQCDMKPEWITYWSKKMRELHEEELVKKQEEILKDLGLPINAIQEDIDMRKSNENANSQDASFVEKELKILRHRSLRSREKSKDRDRSYENKFPMSGDRNYRGRSRERRERMKRSRDRSWDKGDADKWKTGYKRDIDERFKYGKDPRDSKIRKFSPPSRDTFNSRNFTSSRYISEQMSKVEKERKDVKWSIYHSKMRIFKDNLNKEFEEHEENPKSHPLYHSEWLKFRSKCSLADNDSSFDINSEWNKFWRRKMKELYDRDLNEKLDRLLKELGLNRESPTKIKYFERKYDNDSPESRMRKTTTKQQESKSSQMNENLNVIVVLRQLTALENYLGSLGPKVIDLLAAVLKMEKDKPNSSEDILSNDLYLVLLETVKEKLKGQLIAELIDPHVIQATKTAIQYTASLLHKASLKAEEEKKKMEEMRKNKSLPVAGVGPVEKAAIANQIADVLIAQGKTDVTTEELEKLINAVVGMANASQSSMTSTSLLSQLMEIQNPPNNDKDRNPLNGLQAIQTAYNKNVPVSSSPGMSSQESSFNDKLSDSDLKTLFQNFKDLSPDEQQGLMTYIRKLEAKNPERVQNLQKVVTIDLSFNRQAANIENNRSQSPFANRSYGMNPTLEEKNRNPDREINKPFPFKSKDSDDDEDYSYEEVIKSAAEKAKEKQLQEELEIIKQSLRDSSNSAEEKTDPPKETPETVTSIKEPDVIIPNQDFDIASLANVLQLVKNATNLQNVMANSPSNTYNNQQYQAPNSQPYQAPNNPPYQAPSNQPYQAPNNQPYQAPNNQPYQAPNNQPHQAQNNQPFQASNNQSYQAPNNPQYPASNNPMSIRPPNNMNSQHKEPVKQAQLPSLFDQKIPAPPMQQNTNNPRHLRDNVSRPSQSNQYQNSNQFQNNQFQTGNQFQNSNQFSSNQFQSSNQYQNTNQFNDMSRSILPPSSGLSRMAPDSYPQNTLNKIDPPIQNSNQFSGDRPPMNNYQKPMNMPPKYDKFDNQSKMGFGNQTMPNNSFNKMPDFGNRFGPNDTGYQANSSKMGWNNPQGNMNQFEMRTPPMNNQGSSGSDYNQYNSSRGRGNQRGSFPNRGRGNRPFGDNKFRRGGGMNY